MNITKFIQINISAFMKERYKMLVLTGVLIILIDQIIKIIITMNISYATTIGYWIKITNVANTGIAYGIRKE